MSAGKGKKRFEGTKERDAYIQYVKDYACRAGVETVLQCLGVSWKPEGENYVFQNDLRGQGHIKINRDSGDWLDFGDSDKWRGDIVELVKRYQGAQNALKAADILAGWLGIGDGDIVASIAAGTVPARPERKPKAVPHYEPGEFPVTIADKKSGIEKPVGVCVVPVPDDVGGLPGQIFTVKDDASGKTCKLWDSGRWAYRDASGRVIFWRVRFNLKKLDSDSGKWVDDVEPVSGKVKKEFRPYSWVIKDRKKVGEWFRKSPPVMTLYGLEKLATMAGTVPVLLCEGEKATDAAQALFPDWPCLFAGKNADVWPLSGRDVLLWPDSDDAGKKNAQALGEALRTVGCASVKVLSLEAVEHERGEALPAKWDAHDAQTEGYTGARLLAIPGLFPDAQEALQDGTQETLQDAATSVPGALVMAHPRFTSGDAVLYRDGKRLDYWDAYEKQETGYEHGIPLPGYVQVDPSRFCMRTTGLWVLEGNGDKAKWMRIVAAFRVLGRFRHENNRDYGTLLLVQPTAGEWVLWGISGGASDDKGSAVGKIFNGAMGVASRTNSGAYINAYLQHFILHLSKGSGVDCTLYENTGFRFRDGGKAFHHPGVVVTDSAVHYIDTSGKLGVCPPFLNCEIREGARLIDCERESWFKGNLDGWRSRVALPMLGNRFGVLALCTAFAGCSISARGKPSFMVHFGGVTSTGKTTLAAIATSVWGFPGEHPIASSDGGMVRPFRTTWNMTATGREDYLVSRSGMLGMFDDLQNGDDPDSIRNTPYMISAGTPKGRSKRSTYYQDGGWSLVLLSTGETTFKDHLKNSGISIPGGVDVRLLDFNLVKEETGNVSCFDVVPEGCTAKEFADRMKATALDHYGWAGVEFARAMLCPDRVGRMGGLARVYARQFAGALNADPAQLRAEIGRTVNMFVELALAGEVAIEAGLLPFPEGHCVDMLQLVLVDMFKDGGYLDDDGALFSDSRKMREAGIEFAGMIFAEQNACFRHWIFNGTELKNQPPREHKGVIEYMVGDGDDSFPHTVYLLSSPFNSFCGAHGVRVGAFCAYLAERGVLKHHHNGKHPNGNDKTSWQQYKKFKDVGRARYYWLAWDALESLAGD